MTDVGGGAADGVWRRRDDVLWRRSLEAVILLPAGADEPLTLPDTGAIVWDLLEEPATFDELVATLADVYNTDATTIATDITPLLTELQTRGALEHT
jgi:Coenzyme PQQ synthesis protein D (PqqD)